MDKLSIYYVGEVPLIKEDSIHYVDIQHCLNYLKDKKVISIDIETSFKFKGKYEGEGLDPYLSTICMFQIGDEERQYVVDARKENIKVFKSILEDKSITKIGHNIKFEYKHILHNYGIRLNNVYDTMIVEKILFNGIPTLFSLKELNKRYLNITVEKTIRNEFALIQDKPFTLRQIRYGAEDILYPLLIREHQVKDIYKKHIQRCVSLEMLFIPVLGDIEYKGMHFNTEVWSNTYKENLVVFEGLKDTLDKYVIENFKESKFIDKQLDLFSLELKCTIKWTSSKQVIEFFKYLNVCPKEVSKTTKKLSYTVNAKVLGTSLNTINKNIEKHKKDLILLYLKFKEAEQSVTTFGIKFFKHINPVTNRLHSNYNQIVSTGRISSSSPNLQNIPGTKGFRSAFDSPQGYKIVNADYSGQEQVILANKSKDKDLINFYELGLGDMHKD